MCEDLGPQSLLSFSSVTVSFIGVGRHVCVLVPVQFTTDFLLGVS